MRKLLIILTGIIWIALPLQAFDLSEMTDAERQQFRDEVRSYLLEYPEVLMEAIEVLREREEEQAAKDAEAERAADLELVSQYREELYNDGYSYIGGNPDGDLTIVEFLDYRCTYCRRAHPELTEILKQDGNIRWIVKEYPILGQESVNSSKVAIATLQTQGPEAYLRMHDVLMTYDGPVNSRTIGRLARSAKVDADAILAVYDSEAISDQIAEVRELGAKMRVSGTPTFTIGDLIVRGYLPSPQFKGAIEHGRSLSN